MPCYTFTCESLATAQGYGLSVHLSWDIVQRLYITARTANSHEAVQFRQLVYKPIKA